MKQKNGNHLLKAAAAILLCAVLLCAAAMIFHKTHHAVVLEYHCVGDEPFSAEEHLFVRPSELEDQITALQDAGYRFVFADEADPLCFRKTVCLTFDDGYKDNLTELLPVLERTGAKATVFVAADLIGFNDYFLSREDLQTLAASPCIRIGSHGVTHRDLLELSEEETESELRESKRILEEITGKEVTAFSYPGGHYSWQQAQLAGEIYRNCFTAAGGNFYLGLRNHRNLLPRIAVRRGESGEALLERIEAAQPGRDVYSGY